MSSYDDELVEDLVLNELKKCVKVINNQELFLNIIERKFEFRGLNIDWLQTDKHYSLESNNLSLLTDARIFITELKERSLNDNVQIMYIGDNLTEYGYQFDIKNIESLLVYFLEIPQHHYFVPLEGDWCLCISFENCLDFGFSLNKS